MSQFYVDGLRRLADALEAAPIQGVKYPDQSPSFQINLEAISDVAVAAGRFGVRVRDWGDGQFASVDFGGVLLNLYAEVDVTK